VDLVKLENLGGGVMAELFADSLRRVADNIVDDNTPAKALRQISITVKFKPNDSREQVAVEVHPNVKLAPVKPYETGVYMAMDGSNVKMLQPEIPHQPEMNFDNEIEFKKEMNE
jgi:hypothetical protein